MSSKLCLVYEDCKSLNEIIDDTAVNINNTRYATMKFLVVHCLYVYIKVD